MEPAKQPSTPIHSTEKKPNSIGGGIFDWFTYGGLAGVGTFLLTIPVAHLLVFGKAKPFRERAIKWLEENPFAWVSEKSRTGMAEASLMTLILMQGGNLLLIPISFAEKFKKQIVNGLNSFFGDKTDPATVEEAPPQTVGSLMKGRMVAFFAVFASLISLKIAFPKTTAMFETEFGERLCKLFKQPTEVLKKINGEDVAVSSKTFEYGMLAALDVFATAGSAILLYVGGHFFARKTAEKKALKAEATHHPEQAALRDKIANATPEKLPTKPDAKVGTILREDRIERLTMAIPSPG